MRTIEVSTELALPAERACAMAQRAPVFLHVVWPVLTVHDRALTATDRAFAPGETIAARLWLLAGLIPGWRHEITVVERTPTLLRTRERGGALRTWNHELRFEPLGDARCRYTDRVELDAGPLTAITAAGSVLFYRWRQRRWRRLAALVA